MQMKIMLLKNLQTRRNLRNKSPTISILRNSNSRLSRKMWKDKVLIIHWKLELIKIKIMIWCRKLEKSMKNTL